MKEARRGKALHGGSVRRKLVYISMLASTVALVLAGIALTVSDRLAARTAMRQELEVLATVIGDRSTAALVFQDRQLARENLAAAGGRDSVLAACIYDQAGTLFATFEPGDETCRQDPTAEATGFTGRYLVATRAIELDGEQVGTIQLRSGVDELEVRLQHHVKVVLLVILLAAGVALFFTTRLQAIVSEPIADLARAAMQVSRYRDYSVRAEKKGDDELGLLVDAFNGMLGTIEEQNRELTLSKQRLEQAVDELESRNAELERFTYTVSHDLKSPLITISGFLGHLMRDAEAGDIQRVRRDVDRIKAATQQMSRLLNELLDLSRIGRQVNPHQEFEMSALVEEALAIVSGRIEERGVEIVVEPGLPRATGDRQRLLEVVQNLVENGVKFMGEQNAPRIEIGSRTTDEGPVFFVRDNGIGIPPQYHEKVFGLFERLTTGTEGTGIGLAIVQRIIELHKGRVWVESAGDGEGATFYFTLPEADDEGAPGPSRAGDLVPGKPVSQTSRSGVESFGEHETPDEGEEVVL